MIERAVNYCEYCRIDHDDQFFAFEIDHIIAEKHGGPTQSDNLCLACPECNAFKGSDIASVDWSNNAAVVPLYHPRHQTWQEHYQLDASNGRVAPLTPKHA